MTNRVQVDVPHYSDPTYGTEEMEIEASFDIPVASRVRLMAIIGLVLHIIGWLVLIAMGIFFIINYPDNWEQIFRDPCNGGIHEDCLRNEAELQNTKEWTFSLALFGAAPLFVGLALYTYGRTFRGDQDDEAGGRQRQVVFE